MQTQSPTGPETIVVGVNGGPAGRGALRWALQYAERTGAHVRAVRAWHVPLDEQVVAELPDLDVAPSLIPPSAPLREEEVALQSQALARADLLEEALEARFEREALHDLRSAVDGARAATGANEVDVQVEVLEGEPARVVCETAQGADLLVLGCRERSPMTELVLGSVSHQCVRMAPCPVVIVPAHVAEARRQRAQTVAPAAATKRSSGTSSSSPTSRASSRNV